MMAYLRASLRLPCRAIQEYLEIVHEVRLSVGDIVEVLHRVRREVELTLEQLLHTTTWLRSPCDLWS